MSIKPKTYLFLYLIFGITTCIFSQESQKIKSLEERIDNHMNANVSNGYSASILIAVDGKILLKKGYGMMDRKSNEKITSNTIFNIGSITKQFTAAAILKLQEQSKLNVKDSLSVYFKNLPETKGSITIHQLLTHTSGIDPRTGGYRYDEATKSDFLEKFKSIPLLYSPGTKHTYANGNYILLALLIEKVTGKTYEDFLSKELLNPSGMNSTFYQKTPIDSKIAKGYYYHYTDGKWKDWGITADHLPKNHKYWFSVGKGDISSTTLDLYRWHEALENNLVLSPTSKKLLETPFVAENANNSSFYGYGWAIYNTKENQKIVTHNGSNGIYFADFIRAINEKIVVIALSNVRLNTKSENLAWTIYRMLKDSNYNPKVIPKNTYELVNDFIKNNTPEKIDLLPQFIQENTGESLSDKSLLNRIGFAKVSKGTHPKWGIQLLKLNVKLFPNDGNLYDSLGEAYYLTKDTVNAKASFKKAIDLQPKENCHWCNNSNKRLQELNNR